MKRHAKNALKLALYTRRFNRHGHPLSYRFARWLAKRYFPREPGKGVELIADYDAGQLRIDTGSKIEHCVLFHGYHEPEVARLIKRLVRPGDLCLDVGANIGAHTLLMAFAAGPEGRVVALEPHPEVRARLAANVALNRLQNVALVPAALSDADGEAALYTFAEGAANRGCSSLKRTEGATGEMRIRTVTGETLTKAAKLDGCHFIKIDVEGHELVALRELSALIEAHRPTVLFEYAVNHWKAHDASITDALALVRGWGYTLFAVKDDFTRPLLKDPTSNCDLLCIPPAQAEIVLRD